jgi:hypothetical protein
MIVYYPNLQSKNVYNGFLIAIILGYCIAMINSYFLINSYNIFEGKDLVFITQKVFSKFSGKLIILIHIITSFLTGITIYLPLIIVMGSNIMPTTSRLYISVFIVLIYIVAIRNTQNTILYGMGFFALFAAVLVPTIFVIIGKEIDTRFIIGAISHSIRSPLLVMIISATYFFDGIENLAVYNPSFGKKSIKLSFLLYAIVGIPLSLFPILIPIGVWGPHTIKDLTLPILATSDTVSLDLFIIERTLYIMLPLYISLQILGSITYFYTTYTLINKSISNNKIKIAIFLVILISLLVMPIYLTDFESMLSIGRFWGYAWFIIMCLICPYIYIKCKGWMKKQL